MRKGLYLDEDKFRALTYGHGVETLQPLGAMAGLSPGSEVDAISRAHYGKQAAIIKSVESSGTEGYQLVSLRAKD